MIAPRSDGRAAGLPIGPEGAVVVGDRTDTEDVEPEAPLTRRVLDEDGAGAFVEALDLDLRDGCGGISPSTSSSNAEVEAIGSSAAGALLGAGLADDGAEEEATGTGATDGYQALEPRRPNWHVRQESAGSAGRNGAVETRTAATTAARRSTFLITIGCMLSPSKRQNSVERAGPITTMAIAIEKREVCKTHRDSRCRFVLIRGTNGCSR